MSIVLNRSLKLGTKGQIFIFLMFLLLAVSMKLMELDDASIYVL